MRSISARSVGITFLCAAIFAGLSAQGPRRAAAGEAATEAAAAVPSGCGVGVLSPVKNKIVGTMAAKGVSECINGKLVYMRLKVKLQVKVHGVWKSRAGAVGEPDRRTDRLAVQVFASCRIGLHRSLAVPSFRQNATDPWQVGLRWGSPALLVKRCPIAEQGSVAADGGSQTIADFPLGCGATAFWPARRQGRLIATTKSRCDSPWYMRLIVRLQRETDGVWSSSAAATADRSQPTGSLGVKVSILCRPGRYRTYGLPSFRQDPADPWQVAPVISAVVGVGRCP